MAVDTTTKQMALTRNLGFMERVQATMAFVTSSILKEPRTVAYHAERARYAQLVVANPANMASQAGPQVVMGVNVVAATTYDEATKTSECSIADIDLESQIQSLWNSLAGIDTPAA